MARPKNQIKIAQFEGRDPQNCRPEVLDMLKFIKVLRTVVHNPLEDVTFAAYTSLSAGSRLVGALSFNMYPHLSDDSRMHNLTPGIGRSAGIYLAQQGPYEGWPAVTTPLLGTAENVLRAHGMEFSQVRVLRPDDEDILAHHGYAPLPWRSSAWEKQL